jgi:hypothetical protein
MGLARRVELRQAENDRAGGARRTRKFWEEDFQ